MEHEVNYNVHKSPPIVPIQSKVNPVNTISLYISRTREWLVWQGPEATVRVNYRTILSSERAPHINKSAIVKQKKKMILGSRCEPSTKTDWLTDRWS
jgi:hypothetical protein